MTATPASTAPQPPAHPPAPSEALRVALLSPVFWPEVRRGGERIARELADGLLARGHRPRLITSHRGPTSRTIEDGLPVVRVRRPPDGLLLRRGFEEHLTHLPGAYLALRGGDDQVATAIYPTDALAAARWSRRTGRPSVLTYLGIPDRRGLVWRRWRTAITLRAVAGSAATVALSHTAADAFRRWLGVDARVIHPGVDLRAFSPGGERAELPTIFCAATPDEPRKRVGLLVRAFARVRRERPGARLVLVRPDDAALGRRLAGEPGVELVAAVEGRAQMAGLYRAAWVSALPSVGESFGLVLAEALACGTPVVGSNLGAIPEVVDRDSIGRLFDGDGERELARALLEALELSRDPATPVACRARAEEFSTERSASAYEALYRELLEGGP